MSQYDPLPRSSIDERRDVLRSHRIRSIYPLTRRFRRACRPLYVGISLVFAILWQINFNTSYTNPPTFTIPTNETVFIAANIINGDLINGAWGDSLVRLVDLIGAERVFVSIYGGPASALEKLSFKLACNTSLVAEISDPIILEDIPHTTLPTGEKRVKRIAYLAEVRNKALLPLQETSNHFDKVLFINDVFFKAEDATRLLWGTNINSQGESKYKAACGTDFVTSWKYYDTYGTRDLEGYSIGVPIFPWFSAEGEAVTRKDILAGKDAVRVKSCWGGIVAFEAKYFTQGNNIPHASTASLQLPLRFRSEPEPFWDASECCLIHADIMALPDSTMPSTNNDTGIYMNPYVRVAYDARSFANIGFVKRFERLFALPQAIINQMAHMPRFNVRRTENEGEIIKDRIWVSSSKDTKRATLGNSGNWKDWANRGHYEDYDRNATRGGYCGVRQLLVLKEGKLQTGEGNWDNLLSEVPPLEY